MPVEAGGLGQGVKASGMGVAGEVAAVGRACGSTVRRVAVPSAAMS